jgi:mono/diheme cytochrome c family protein
MKKVLAAMLLIVAISGYVNAQTKKKKSGSGASAKPSAATMEHGAKIYTLNCLTCHFVDGGGVPNMNPPLSKTSWVLGDKPRLIKVVLNGFAQNVEIDGQTYSNNMAPHAFLKDDEIADVLTYVRNSFGNKASAVKVSEVKAVRAAKK